MQERRTDELSRGAPTVGWEQTVWPPQGWRKARREAPHRPPVPPKQQTVSCCMGVSTTELVVSYTDVLYHARSARASAALYRLERMERHAPGGVVFTSLYYAP